MKTDLTISGIHHITAITASAVENLNFYENVLGLRLVKRTVNFDDPHTYHFYYADGEGSPGTILTFFPWEQIPKGRQGAGVVTSIAFAIGEKTTDYWIDRLSSFGISTTMEERFGRKVILFVDPRGLPLELINDASGHGTTHWPHNSVSRSQGLKGFHSTTATVNTLTDLKALLVGGMGFTLEGRDRNRYRFKMADATPGRYYDVVVDPQTPEGRQGSGTVHHIAFRTRNGDEQLQWQTQLRNKGLAVTPVRDRKYFKSIYYSTPGGVLFEIATDTPGFSVDELIDRLGTGLVLPPAYESRRGEIEQHLPALREASFHHVFVPSAQADNADGTVITLHGTGGDEHDLLPIWRDAEGVKPSSARGEKL